MEVTPDIPQITDEQYAMVTGLAVKQVTIERQVEALEEELKQAKKELDNVRDKLLPNALLELGVTEITLKSGHKISVKREAYASITEERKAKCFSWLRSHGHGSIIKNVISTEFGKGEDEKAIEAAALLAENGYRPTQKESVHPQTLKAFIRELDEKGEDFPYEDFGAFIINRSKVEKK